MAVNQHRKQQTQEKDMWNRKMGMKGKRRWRKTIEVTLIAPLSVAKLRKAGSYSEE